MKALVLWADNLSANLGVRVLAQGSADLVRRAYGDDTDVEFQDFGQGESAVSFNGRSILRDIGRSSGPIKTKLAAYDLVVDTGAGDSFTDIYGLKRLLIIAYARAVAGRLGIPVVMSPQTIGPFNTWLGRVVAKRVLKSASAVTVRDSQSTLCSESLGRRVDAVGTDVVFALDKVESAMRYDVLLNVSGLLWGPNPHVDSDEYARSVRALIAALARRNHRVAIIAHVLENGHADSDLVAVEQLRQELPKQVDVLVPFDLNEARQLISASNLVIGSRMHACLNALSCGVPTIPWAYSRKFAPLFRDLGWEHVVDLRTESDPVGVTLQMIDSFYPDIFGHLVATTLGETEKRLDQVVDALRVETWDR